MFETDFWLPLRNLLVMFKSGNVTNILPILANVCQCLPVFIDDWQTLPFKKSLSAAIDRGSLDQISLDRIS
jgi:hypothetical protein